MNRWLALGKYGVVLCSVGLAGAYVGYRSAGRATHASPPASQVKTVSAPLPEAPLMDGARSAVVWDQGRAKRANSTPAYDANTARANGPNAASAYAPNAAAANGPNPAPSPQRAAAKSFAPKSATAKPVAPVGKAQRVAPVSTVANDNSRETFRPVPVNAKVAPENADPTSSPSESAPKRKFFYGSKSAPIGVE